jgi:hypothetical protein
MEDSKFTLKTMHFIMMTLQAVTFRLKLIKEVFLCDNWFHVEFLSKEQMTSQMR